jgi:Protein of unknown function (DUF1499)
LPHERNWGSASETDNVVVRIAADGAGARIDMRSVSRLGRSDFGVNARRVQIGSNPSTTLALRCRWKSRPQHQQRIRAAQRTCVAELPAASFILRSLAKRFRL